MPTLYYDFGNDRKSIPFEYEMTFDDLDEAMDYILRTRSPKEIVRDYIECFSDGEDILDEYDEEELRDLDILKSELLIDLIHEDFYDDELKDYFEDVAYQEYEDGIEEEKFRRNLPW